MARAVSRTSKISKAATSRSRTTGKAAKAGKATKVDAKPAGKAASSKASSKVAAKPAATVKATTKSATRQRKSAAAPVRTPSAPIERAGSGLTVLEANANERVGLPPVFRADAEMQRLRGQIGSFLMKYFSDLAPGSASNAASRVQMEVRLIEAPRYDGETSLRLAGRDITLSEIMFLFRDDEPESLKMEIQNSFGYEYARLVNTVPSVKQSAIWQALQTEYPPFFEVNIATAENDISVLSMSFGIWEDI